MASVLIIKLGALGDLVQADGAMRDIREHHSDDRITIMTTPAYRRYAERCPWVDEVFLDPRASRFNLPRMFSLAAELRDRDFDRVYDLQQVGRTRFYKRWLFPKVDWLGDVKGCNYYLRRPDDSCAADHFARHLVMAGISVQHTLRNNVSWMADDVDDILGAAELKPGFVVLIPGASAIHDGKRWPYFKDFAERLLAHGRQVVTIPGPEELDLCRTIPGTMLVEPGGYHDFFTLAGIVLKAGFVIGNDTGPTHIAAHLQCPGLALYGPHTSPASTGIQHSRFSWIEAPNLNELSVDAVWEKLGLRGFC